MEEGYVEQEYAVQVGMEVVKEGFVEKGQGE